MDPLTREVFVRSVTDVLGPEERAVVHAALEVPDCATEGLDLSANGKAVYQLLTAHNLDEAVLALEGLPAFMRARLTALSPLARLHDVRTPVIVFGHDRDDAVVPVSESRRLRQELAGRTGVHYTEFALFQHATPRRLPPLRFIRELGRFFLYVYPVFRAVSAHSGGRDAH